MKYKAVVSYRKFAKWKDEVYINVIDEYEYEVCFNGIVYNNIESDNVVKDNHGTEIIDFENEIIMFCTNDYAVYKEVQETGMFDFKPTPKGVVKGLGDEQEETGSV